MIRGKVLFVIIGLAGIFVVLLGTCPALADDLYVSTAGNDTGSCKNILFPCSSPNYALSVSAGNDMVKIAVGTYLDNVSFAHVTGSEIRIQGGWSQSFDRKTADPSLTVIDGGGSGSVLDIKLYATRSGIKVENLTITHGDIGTGEGGGILVWTDREDTSVTIHDTVIVANSANVGGGLYVKAEGTATVNVDISRNRLLANAASFSGGGLTVRSYDSSQVNAIFENNVIADNSGPFGGSGMEFVAHSDSRLRVSVSNNTLFDQSASVRPWGSGVSLTVNIINSILDRVEMADRPVEDRVYAFVFHSWMQRSPYNSRGNVTIVDPVTGIDDPLFEKPSTGDYHLRYGSPLIDRGICKVWGTPASPGQKPPYVRIAPEGDMDGETRPSTVEGCDVGADEFVAVLPAPTAAETHPYAPTVSPVASNKAAECRPFAVGDVTGGTLDLTVGLPEFQEPVDVYLGIASEALVPDDVLLVTADGFGLLSQGPVPWRTDMTSTSTRSLFGEIPVPLLPAGSYALYLLVTPTGNLTSESFYLWATGFSIP